MTPEERATKVLEKMDLNNDDKWDAMIADAIREAVREEREACAKITEGESQEIFPFDSDEYKAKKREAIEIASLIRARGAEHGN